MLAIRSIRDGVKVDLKKALELEIKYFAECVQSNQAKGSIHTFFLRNITDKPRGMMSKGFQPKEIKKAAVIGLGSMGQGIVIDILRQMQIPVVVKDNPEALESGREFIYKTLSGMAEKKRLKSPVNDLMALLTVTSEYSDDFKDVDMAAESVSENTKVKKAVYGELCNIVPDDCILASITSSIPITELAMGVKNPGRFIGCHFFSPVWRMELLEIIKGKETSRDTIDNLLNFSAAIRKRPIICHDNPGFIVNAILFSMLQNAFDMLEKGVAIEQLDKAMESYGMSVGPVKLLDEVGIDIPYNVMKANNMKIHATFENIIKDGRYGLKKGGRGLFLKDGRVDPDVLPLILIKEKHSMSDEEIQDAFFTAMLKTSKELLDKKVVENPYHIDIGMIWGAGFPFDKGGPLKWADLIGKSSELFGKTFY